MNFFKRLQLDIDGFISRDPAARSRIEVAFCYPGFHALLVYRLSHWLWVRNWKLTGRLLSNFGRMVTGIEIHPGARIGRGLVIDHGHGAVIGETSTIGDDVTLYQGVTLGGIAPSVNSRALVDQKRHPTLCDGVIVGSGAQILGPITIGEGARVGANAVVTRDIPPGVTAAGIPARVLMPRDRAKAREFVAYGTPVEELFDPVLRNIDSLRSQLTILAQRVEELEARLGEEAAGESDQEGDRAVETISIRDKRGVA